MSDSGHVVLLGDSIFDNAAYTRGGPDVVTQLRDTLPRGWRATLAAVDGAVTAGVERQFRGVPDDAGFLVVSTGGNDALGHVDILGRGARSVAEALELLADMADRFERDYRRMLALLRDTGLPAAVCTIYYPRFPEPHGAAADQHGAHRLQRRDPAHGVRSRHSGHRPAAGVQRGRRLRQPHRAVLPRRREDRSGHRRTGDGGAAPRADGGVDWLTER